MVRPKAFGWVGLLMISFFAGIEQSYAQVSGHSLDIRVQHMPDIVVIAGAPTVYYEIHVTNAANDSIELKSIEVFDTADSRIVFSIDNANLENRCSRIGDAPDGRAQVLAPGASSLIYIEGILREDKAVIQLRHRIWFELLQRGSRRLLFAEGGIIKPSRKSQLILGQPVGKGIWAAVYDPAWERGHRRVMYTVDGKNYIPGRFAIDFIRMDNEGKYSNGDDNVVKNWYGYGNDVLAVADGVVASTRDDFSESATLAEHPKYPADKATGNYVSLRIGDSLLAFYEHLKPKSIKVKPGQRVKKGDVIASLGFTGQTTGPHLHFHIANLNSPLGAEGIPFVFEHFTNVGSYADFGKFGKAPWTPAGNTIKVDEERPAPNSVVTFPD